MTLGAIVIAPFSGGRIRDWPVGMFSDLIGLCVTGLPAHVMIVGSSAQRTPANLIVRKHSAERVSNLCGRLKFDEAQLLLAGSSCVVTNNSGLGHYAANMGLRSVCIFSGTHAISEWGPRGPRTIAITRKMPCSPCNPSRDEFCPIARRCLKEITPELVFSFVERHCASWISERA